MTAFTKSVTCFLRHPVTLKCLQPIITRKFILRGPMPPSSNSWMCLLAGSFPATAFLNLRMFGTQGMIARLGPDQLLHQHGVRVLLNYEGRNLSRSWFPKIRVLCQQYHLPDSLLLMQSPPNILSLEKADKITSHRLVGILFQGNGRAAKNTGILQASLPALVISSSYLVDCRKSIWGLKSCHYGKNALREIQNWQAYE